MLAHQQFTIRSTAISGVAIGLTVGAGAFLLVWWLRSALRRGRRRAGKHVRVRTPRTGNGRGSGTGLVRRRRPPSYGSGSHRTIYRGRLPRTLPGIPAPAGLTGTRSPVPGDRVRARRVRCSGASGPRSSVRRAKGPRPGLGAATAYVGVGTLLSRVTGLLRILVAIYALGYSNLSDSFNLANNTPNIIHDLVLGGILTATFVPVFVSRLATRSEDEAVDSISAVLTLVGVRPRRRDRAACARRAPCIIDLYTIGSHEPGLAAERQVATSLLRLFSPQLLAYGAISLMTAVLNAVRRFTAPAFAPILNNLVAIGVLLAFAAVGHTHNLAQVHHDHRLLLLLGVGTTLGVVLQAVVPRPEHVAVRPAAASAVAPERPRGARRSSPSRAGPSGSSSPTRSPVFVVSALAVSIGSATITAYTYAFTFFQLPFGIVAVSVMTTIAPVLAARFTRGDNAGFAEQFGLGLRRMLAGVLPAAVGYLLLARPAISLISRGAGSAHHSSGSATHGVDARASRPRPARVLRLPARDPRLPGDARHAYAVLPLPVGERA